MVAGWWVFDHVPGPMEWVGVALIASCGVAAGWLTAHQNQPAARGGPDVPEP
jgi:drug/metabolite transporter (DMT)-like permease